MASSLFDLSSRTASINGSGRGISYALTRGWRLATAPFGHFLALFLLVTAPAWGQAAYPVKPIRLLVGSAAGGGTDFMARVIADKLQPVFKQAVTVDNRPGASNTIAADLTVKAAPDGYTLLMGVITSQAIAPHLIKLSFDPLKDLQPVALVATVPNVLIVNNDVKAKSVKDLVALIKANPGKYKFASSGVGSTQHIAGEAFKQAAGLDIDHIPYKGSSQALIDVIGGEVQMSFDTMPSVIQQIRNGKVRPLAVTTPKRSSQLPDVPTIAEAGYPGLLISAWYGIYAPAKTPRDIVDRLHDEVAMILAMPDVIKRLDSVGGEPMAMTIEQFAEFNRTEYARYGKLIKDSGIRLE